MVIRIMIMIIRALRVGVVISRRVLTCWV